ncbi:MAG: PIN domain-containing protein [Acidobacteriaceae bacterium]
MMLLVDTSVWSLAFRRRPTDLNPRELAIRELLEKAITEGRVALLGSIRQELLAGIRDERQFQRLRNALRAFPDVPLTAADYEEAARLSNVCRRKGIAGSPVDFLICSVALLRNWPIFTLDRDFARFSEHIQIRLLNAP